jgi:hypothetical protein
MIVKTLQRCQANRATVAQDGAARNECRRDASLERAMVRRAGSVKEQRNRAGHECCHDMGAAGDACTALKISCAEPGGFVTSDS